MTVILPIIAILSVTSEWSQRSGLTTFTLVPHRGRVLLAKALAAVLVGVASMVVAFAVGALGNLVGAAIAGIPPVWDQDLADVGYFVLGNTLLLLVGFMLGVLIRNSAGAIVAYLVYAFVAPGLLAFLASTRRGSATCGPGSTPSTPRTPSSTVASRVSSGPSSAVTTLVWLVLPLLAAVVTLLRSEVK